MARYYTKSEQTKNQLEQQRQANPELFAAQLLLASVETSASYPSLTQEVARLSKMYGAADHTDLMITFDGEGWTKPMHALAHGDPQKVPALLAKRKKTIAAEIAYVKTKMSFPAMNACFIVRDPFLKGQREIAQQISTLAPYTSLFYFHSPAQSPMLFANVIIDTKALAEFQSKPEIAKNPHVLAYTEAQGCVTVEYVHNVHEQSKALQTTSITSNLGAFYKEHDNYQKAMNLAIRNAIAKTELNDPLQVVSAYLVCQHPLPGDVAWKKHS